MDQDDARRVVRATLTELGLDVTLTGTGDSGSA